MTGMVPWEIHGRPDYGGVHEIRSDVGCRVSFSRTEAARLPTIDSESW